MSTPLRLSAYRIRRRAERRIDDLSSYTAAWS
jgi:hypothetical protein